MTRVLDVVGAGQGCVEPIAVSECVEQTAEIDEVLCSVGQKRPASTPIRPRTVPKVSMAAWMS